MINPEMLKLKKIFSLIPKNKDILIGDFGCGTGLVSHSLIKNGYDVESFDVDPKKVEESNKKYGIGAKKKDFLDCKLEKYDVILLWGVIDYIGDLERVFAKINNEVKKMLLSYWKFLTSVQYLKELDVFLGWTQIEANSHTTHSHSKRWKITYQN